MIVVPIEITLGDCPFSKRRAGPRRATFRVSQNSVLMCSQVVRIRIDEVAESVDHRSQNDRDLPHRRIIDIRAVVDVDPLGLESSGISFAGLQGVVRRVIQIGNRAFPVWKGADILPPVLLAVPEAKGYDKTLPALGSGGIQSTPISRSVGHQELVRGAEVLNDN
jgi:hypothetical protein